MEKQTKKGTEKKRQVEGEDYYIRTLLKNTKIKAIMSHPVISIQSEAPFHEVPELFKNNDIRHLPVIDEEDKLVGLITRTDLYQIQSPRRKMDGSWYYDSETLDNIILRHVMIKDPLTLHPENTIAETILPMVSHKYGCIPIVDENNILRGIMTQHDILKMAAEILKE